METSPKTKNRRSFKMRPSHIITLGFLALILFGGFLFSLPISHKDMQWHNYADALLTSASAVSVAGIVVIDDLSVFGNIILIILIQAGGLGFMTLATLVFIIIKKRITLRDRMVIKETMGEEKLSGLVKLMRNIALLTVIIEFIGGVLLLPVFVIDYGARGIYMAFFMSVSAFCNAGIDIVGTTAMQGYGANIFTSLTLCSLIFLGGIGFSVMSDVAKAKRFSKLSLHSKIVLITSGGLILSGFVFFFANEFNNSASTGGLNVGQKLMLAFFESVNIRTAGFDGIDVNAMTPQSKLFAAFLMFIGASPASTGGGLRTTTAAILIFMVISGIKGESEIIINKQTVNKKTAVRAVTILLFIVFLILTMSLLISIIEHKNISQNPELFSAGNILFECLASVCTTGYSTGITAALSPLGKVIISLGMLFGRIGPITIGLMILSKPNDFVMTYPEATIILG